jgi:fructokinase
VRLTAGSRDAAATSVAHADLDASGAATYRFELDWQLARVDDLTSYGHVHSGSIATVLDPGATAVHDTVAAARATATVSYDPNARPSLMGRPEQARTSIERMVALSDVVKVSDEDIEWLRPGESVDDVALDWARLGPALIVVTRGAHGASALLARTRDLRHIPAPSVTVVDTVGAGDSFMSGLLSGLLDARLIGAHDARERLQTSELSDLLPAVERGVATAARTVARAGAHAPMRADLL